MTSAGAQRVELEFRGRVLTADGVVLRRVAVSGGRVVTVESLSDWAPTVAHEPGTDVVELGDDEVLLPATEVVGVPGEGRIEVGAPADLVVFAPDAEPTVDGSGPRDPETPDAGQALRGVVRATYAAGRLVAADTPPGRLLGPGEAPPADDPGRGRA